MLITTGQVQNGSIEVNHTALPEGAKVAILIPEDDETFEVSPAEEAALLSAVDEARRGDSISASVFLEELQNL
ncbi:MAG TPA: hypothetical protein VIW64_07050 [Pyrinomonadaceae bacterium]